MYYGFSCNILGVEKALKVMEIRPVYYNKLHPWTDLMKHWMGMHNGDLDLFSSVPRVD